MIQPVVVRFEHEGIANIRRAIQTVEQAVVRAERASVKATRDASRDKERQYAKLAKDVDRWSRDEVRSTERAAREKARIEQREAREKIAIMAKVDREVAQLREKGVRDFERSEREKSRLALQWVKRREREEEAAERRLNARRRQLASTLGGAVHSGVSAGVNKVTGATMGMVGALSQVGGGFSIADSMSSRLTLERNAALLANSAYKGKPGDLRPQNSYIIDRARAASIATGIDANDLVTATRGYVAKSSDYAGGMENMEFFGKIAKSQGADINDVANAAGALRAQNAHLTPDAMKQILLNVIQQGKEGAVEIEDLAKMAGRITKTSGAYKMDQTTAQGQLLGLSQIAYKTSGSAAEASTVISNFADDTIAHRKEIGESGVMDKNGRLLDPAEVLRHVFEKTGGNIGKIMDLGYGKRSKKLFEALNPVYRDAEEEFRAKHPRAAEAEVRKHAASAVVAEVGKMTGATFTTKDLEGDFQNIIKTPAEQLEASFRELRDEVGAKLVPEMTKLIPVIRDLTPRFAAALTKVAPELLKLVESLARFLTENEKVIDSLAAHPVGAIIGFEVTKSIAAAGIGDAVKFALLRAFPTSSVAGAGGGGGGAGLALNPAALAVGGVVGMGLMGKDTIDRIGAADATAGAGAGDLAMRVRLGLTSAQDALKQVEAAKAQTGAGGTLKAALAASNMPLSYVTKAAGLGDITGAEKGVQKFLDAKNLVDSESLKKAIATAVTDGVKDGATAAAPNMAARTTPMPARNPL